MYIQGCFMKEENTYKGNYNLLYKATAVPEKETWFAYLFFALYYVES